MCATIEERRTTGLKLGGEMIPLNLKNHFLVLNISIHALLYLALGNIELENRGFCLISSYLFSFLVAVFFFLETSVLCKHWPLANKVVDSFFLEIACFITYKEN